MLDESIAQEARREPRAGDVWDSTGMTKIMRRSIARVADNQLDVDDLFAVSGYRQHKRIKLKSFQKWTRTATLVSRGRNA